MKAEEEQLPFECGLCNFICSSSEQQTKHNLGHFKQRHCGACDKLLFQIGANWYEINLHVDEICDKSNEMENNSVDFHTENIKIEQVEIEPEPIQDTDKAETDTYHLSNDEFGLNDSFSKNGEPVNNQYELMAVENLDCALKNNVSIPELGLQVLRHKTIARKSVPGTDTKEGLRSHITTHRKPKEEQACICEYCNKSFVNRASIRTHIVNFHSKPYDLGTREKKVFICDYCHKTFDGRNKIFGHMRHVHSKGLPDDTASIKCLLCDKVFANKLELVRHKKFHFSKLQNLEDFKFKCTQCVHRFKYEETLDVHVKVVHECRIPFQCNICGKKHRRITNLRIHAYAHSPQNEFDCSICNKSYKNKGHLAEHMKVHVGFVPKINCEVCGKSFVRQEEVDAHRQVAHEGQKLFECKMCGQNYDNYRSFWRHKRQYSRNIVCHVCAKSFTYNWQLKRHMVEHTGQKPFRCGECGKGFNTSSHLVRHRDVHSGLKRFKCDLPKCGRAYVNKGDLQQHQLADHGIKSNKEFVCSVCLKAFVQKSLLTRHMKSH